MKKLGRLLSGSGVAVWLAIFGTTPVFHAAPQQGGTCQAGNARDNNNSPLARGYDFVPISSDDAYGFYVVYSERIPPVSSGSNAEVGNTSGIYVFDLGGNEILIFGAGYGNHFVSVNDADFDAQRVHEVVTGCIGYQADQTNVRFATPHGHSDHVNGAFFRSLEELGFDVVEIAYHRGDAGLVNGVGGWTPELQNTFNRLLGGDPRNGRPCGEELLSYLSPIGKIWFKWRGGHHTNGSMDLVLDVFDDPADRIVVQGSQAGGICGGDPSDTRLKIKAHGNVRVSGGSEPPPEGPPDEPDDPGCCQGTVNSYGCGVNPDESLVLLSGAPSPGSTIELGVDNPFGTQNPGARPVVWFSWRADEQFPCGTIVADRGMSGAAALGELLVPNDPSPFKVVMGPAWAGAGEYAPIPLAIPNNEHLIGRSIFAQGRLIDDSGAVVQIGLTNGLEIVIEP